MRAQPCQPGVRPPPWTVISAHSWGEIWQGCSGCVINAIKVSVQIGQQCQDKLMCWGGVSAVGSPRYSLTPPPLPPRPGSVHIICFIASTMPHKASYICEDLLKPVKSIRFPCPQTFVCRRHRYQHSLADSLCNPCTNLLTETNTVSACVCWKYRIHTCTFTCLCRPCAPLIIWTFYALK